MKVYRGLVSKTTLKACFNEARETGARYIGVKITKDSLEKPEMVIINSVDFEAKLKYFDEAYTDSLLLIGSTAEDTTVISGFAYANSVGEFGKFMN